MISSNLKRQVMREANNLRRYATDVERNKLRFLHLVPLAPELCIYGQMTGSCYSPRALDLLRKAAVPVSTNLPNEYQEVAYLPTKMWKHGCWTYSYDAWSAVYDRGVFSAIETYIALPEANNEGLIAYLKKEVDTVQL